MIDRGGEEAVLRGDVDADAADILACLDFDLALCLFGFKEWL